MNFRYRKTTSVITLLVTLAIGQVYVGVSFAEPNSASIPEAAPAPLMGILTTRDNKSITVNGASAISGATIATGAKIETPDQVGATINLGAFGTICLAPNTKATVEFDQNGKAVKVSLLEGCAILSTARKTGGTIDTPLGSAGRIDAAIGGSLDVCSPAGATAPAVNQGAAAAAGAGASGNGCSPPAGAAAVPGGIPTAATVALFAGGATGLFLLFRGSDPSPSAP